MAIDDKFVENVIKSADYNSKMVMELMSSDKFEEIITNNNVDLIGFNQAVTKIVVDYVVRHMEEYDNFSERYEKEKNIIANDMNELLDTYRSDGFDPVILGLVMVNYMADFLFQVQEILAAK